MTDGVEGFLGAQKYNIKFTFIVKSLYNIGEEEKQFLETRSVLRKPNK